MTPFADRVADLVASLQAELGDAVEVAFHEDGPWWDLQPANPSASPLAIYAPDSWGATVCFGRSGCVMELGFSSNPTDDEVYSDLDDACWAVIEGGLIERRKGSSSSRWRLTYRNGTVHRGSINWLLPAFPWTEIEVEDFVPYRP